MCTSMHTFFFEEDPLRTLFALWFWGLTRPYLLHRPPRRLLLRLLLPLLLPELLLALPLRQVRLLRRQRGVRAAVGARGLWRLAPLDLPNHESTVNVLHREHCKLRDKYTLVSPVCPTGHARSIDSVHLSHT